MRSSRRIAVIGASGQLGIELATLAAARSFEVAALSHDQVEVTDADAIMEVLLRVHPAVVINCAAFHQVDRCETRPETAFAVNTIGALNVARAAKHFDARSVYVSTDFVFSGDRPPPPATSEGYSESAATAPVNVYGLSKLAGEHAVLASQSSALVVRLASLFGAGGARGKGPNFIDRIIEQARSGVKSRVVTDIYMTLTYAKDAAVAILDLIEADATGVIHVTNTGICTWHALALETLRLLRLPEDIEPVLASIYPTVARRPKNTSLSTGRLAGILGAPLRPWNEALRAYLAEKNDL